MDSNGNVQAPTRRYHGAFSVTQFDNVGSFQPQTNRNGIHWVTLKPDEYIEVNDSIQSMKYHRNSTEV